jgi:hypothetical protein
MEQVAQIVEKELLSWPETEKRKQRFGSTGFWVHGHELGHIHGNWLADLPFSGKQKEELIASGLVTPHHIRPEKDWVTYRIAGSGNATDLIKLFRLNYDRFIQTPADAPGSEESTEGEEG